MCSWMVISAPRNRSCVRASPLIDKGEFRLRPILFDDSRLGVISSDLRNVKTMMMDLSLSSSMWSRERTREKDMDRLATISAGIGMSTREWLEERIVHMTHRMMMNVALMASNDDIESSSSSQATRKGFDAAGILNEKLTCFELVCPLDDRCQSVFCRLFVR